MLAQTTSARIVCSSQAFPWVVAPLKRFPLLCLFPGHSPGGQVLGHGKAGHADADFGDDGGSSNLLNAGNTLEQADGFLNRGLLT